VVKAVAIATLTIVALFLISICIGALAARYKLNLTLPLGFRLLASILPVLAGAAWFRLRVNRRMSHRELAAFAIGMAILDVVTSVVPKPAVSRMSFLDPVSFFVWIATINVLFGLATGSLFGWLLTRRRDPARVT
jgi:hypothetical protein